MRKPNPLSSFNQEGGCFPFVEKYFDTHRKSLKCPQCKRVGKLAKNVIIGTPQRRTYRCECNHNIKVVDMMEIITNLTCNTQNVPDEESSVPPAILPELGVEPELTHQDIQLDLSTPLSENGTNCPPLIIQNRVPLNPVAPEISPPSSESQSILELKNEISSLKEEISSLKDDLSRVCNTVNHFVDMQSDILYNLGLLQKLRLSPKQSLAEADPTPRSRSQHPAALLDDHGTDTDTCAKTSTSKRA